MIQSTIIFFIGGKNEENKKYETVYMCGKDIPVNLTLLDKILKYIRSKLCLQVGILNRIYFLPKRFKIPKTSLSILLCIKKIIY